ncbi:MAG: hypothetical protein HYY45_21675 [Deltaproteobacteria bacterium]|nr:hypothetical protein [Deltaproteobacteria bacterium]
MNKASGNDAKGISFHYKFTLANGDIKEFDLQLDSETLGLITSDRASYPEWTRLSYNQCPCCPLGPPQQLCPIAANLVDVVECFKDHVSYEEADIEVATEVRVYKQRVSLQKGISSLVGIYMVTSGCPIMDKLRPMVKTHLPFATAEETMYRVFSMYLLAQYFLRRAGQKPDWTLKNLPEIYAEVHLVNKSFCKRLLDAHIKDGIGNAVATLDCFAEFIEVPLRRNVLKKIEPLFLAYLRSRPQGHKNAPSKGRKRSGKRKRS